jgi:hypothetical protein
MFSRVTNGSRILLETIGFDTISKAAIKLLRARIVYNNRHLLAAIDRDDVNIKGFESLLTDPAIDLQFKYPNIEGFKAQTLLEFAVERCIQSEQTQEISKLRREKVFALVKKGASKERKKNTDFDSSLLSYTGNHARMFGAKSQPDASSNVESPQVTIAPVLAPT